MPASLSTVVLLVLLLGLSACDSQSVQQAPTASLVSAPVSHSGIDYQFVPAKDAENLTATLRRPDLTVGLSSTGQHGRYRSQVSALKGGSVTALTAVTMDGETLRLPLGAGPACEETCDIGSTTNSVGSVHATLYCEGTRCITILRYDFGEDETSSSTLWTPPGGSTPVQVRQMGIEVLSTRPVSAAASATGRLDITGAADFREARVTGHGVSARAAARTAARATATL